MPRRTSSEFIGPSRTITFLAFNFSWMTVYDTLRLGCIVLLSALLVFTWISMHLDASHDHDVSDPGRMTGHSEVEPPTTRLDRSPLGVNNPVRCLPRLSLTAWLSFCLQPRYRSVVSTDACPSR